MKILTSNGGSYRTGAEIADAVMHYALQLTQIGDSDLISIPFVDDTGAVGQAELIIGWLSNTSAVSAQESNDELVDIHLIMTMYSKAETLTLLRGEPFSDEERAHMQWPGQD